MILLFHKVDIMDPPNENWVHLDFFIHKMRIIKKKRIVSLKDYGNNKDEVVITFDGIYENVYKYAFPVLKNFKYPFELFVIGKFIGKDNRFDNKEPLTRFCNQQQIKEMCQNGGVLQYHSWSHRNLCLLTDAEIEKEIKLIYPCDYFAYPYGFFNERVEKIVKEWYQGAVSVIQGDNSDYQLLRDIVYKMSLLQKIKKIVKYFLKKIHLWPR